MRNSQWPILAHTDGFIPPSTDLSQAFQQTTLMSPAPEATFAGIYPTLPSHLDSLQAAAVPYVGECVRYVDDDEAMEEAPDLLVCLSPTPAPWRALHTGISRQLLPFESHIHQVMLAMRFSHVGAPFIVHNLVDMNHAHFLMDAAACASGGGQESQAHH